ncbi:MAG TPA: SGNH/GDSL hydrolase family protein [Pirellulaceae bacterium]|nr:SGNH/GDSL hydrolase family protein [Pirellulaceae bacterium]
MNCYRYLFTIIICAMWLQHCVAEEPTQRDWVYRPALLRPFWQGDTVEGESVLFIRDEATGEGRASVLFPITQVLTVCNSAGDETYEEGRDYVWRAGSCEIVLPVGSRIVSKVPQDLRRPAKSQKYELTHRDGNGEIFFGAKLEYHEMQTCITYRHPAEEWSGDTPEFDAAALPHAIERLRRKEALSIVLLGDSISTGCNASGWAEGIPFQPAYPELLHEHLEASYESKVTLTNLSVGGTSTPWGLTVVDKVVEHEPNLVILAFGMNDSAGRSADEYKANTQAMIDNIRETLPDAEFILIASMLGNRDWIRLKHEVFPQYRDALASLCQPGIALADMTGIWTEFLKRKHDWDLTGNGVNHPNDFGHRVYAQVLSTLLVPDSR